MRIITEPNVYLLGTSQLDSDELQRFLDSVGASEWTTAGDVDGDILVEVGARTCYQSWKGGRPHEDHLAHIIESGHLSCLEHTVFTVLVTGVSRSLTHELIRHRHLSPSQLSQRYVDESVAEYVCPDVIWGDIELRDEWVSAVRDAHRSYVRLSSMLDRLLTPGHRLAAVLPPDATATDRRKVARQAARSVLPNATETKIQLTGNARAWREVVVKRGSCHAEPEIRKMANRLLDVLVKESPNLFADIRRTPLPDGTHELTTLTNKV